MSALTITVGSKEYPCRLTMGALLRYKRLTGAEYGEDAGLSGTITLLWCCVKSACNADGIPFDYELEDFADGLSPEVLSDWTSSLQGGEKKGDGLQA